MSASEPSRSSEFREADNSAPNAFTEDTEFHQQLKRVLFDVDVPNAGKQAVLDALAQDRQGLSVAAVAPHFSRTFLKRPGTLAALSACLMLSALLTFFWVSRHPGVPLAELGPELNLNSRFLPEFDNNFPTLLPAQGGWRHRGILTLLDKSYGVSISRSSTHDAAVRFFRLHTGKAQPVYGALLQIPADRVDPQPAWTSFDPGKVEYTQLAKGSYATVKWVEADQVYVCIVFGGARELESLGRALQSAAA